MEAGAKIFLIRLSSPEGQRSQLITKESFLIGRSSEADLVVLSLGASRAHLKVSRRDGRIVLEDQGSANGTFVSNQQIPSKVPVPYRGDEEIRLGTAPDRIRVELVELPLELDVVQAQEAKVRTMFREFHTQEQSEAKVRVEKEIEEMRGKTKKEAELLLNSARLEKEKAIQAGDYERKMIIEKAHAEVARQMAEAKRNVDQQVSEWMEAGRLQAANVKVEAQSEAGDIIQEATRKANLLHEKADEDATQMLKATKSQVMAKLAEAEARAEEVIKGARHLATKLRAEAQGELEQAREKANIKSQEIIAEAKRNAHEMEEQAKQMAQKVIEQGHSEVARIRDTFAAEKSDLESKSNELHQAKAKLDKELQDIRATAEATRNEIEKNLGDLRGVLGGAQNDLEKALRKCEETKQDHQRLLDEMKQAKKAMAAEEEKQRALIHSAQEAERNAERVRLEAEKYAKELRDRALVEFESKKRNDETDLVEARRKLLDETRAKLEAEEKKIQAARKHQMLEINRQLELILVPKLQGYKLHEEALKDLHQSLHTAVQRVLTEDNSHAHSDLEKVIPFNPDIQKANRNYWIKMASGVAACLIAMVGYFGFKPEIKHYAAKAMGLTAEQRELSSRQASEVVNQMRDQYKFKPQYRNAFQPTYTDNVLYFKPYFEFKTNPDFNDLWIRRLTEFVTKELRLDEDAVVKITAEEISMIKDLEDQKNLLDTRFLDEKIAKMRATEASHVAEMSKTLKGDGNYKKFRNFERSFYFEMQPE